MNPAAIMQVGKLDEPLQDIVQSTGEGVADRVHQECVFEHVWWFAKHVMTC